MTDADSYEQRLREQHDLDVAEINRLRAENDGLDEALKGVVSSSAKENNRLRADCQKAQADYVLIKDENARLRAQVGQQKDRAIDAERENARLRVELSAAYEARDANAAAIERLWSLEVVQAIERVMDDAIYAMNPEPNGVYADRIVDLLRAAVDETSDADVLSVDGEL